MNPSGGGSGQTGLVTKIQTMRLRTIVFMLPRSSRRVSRVGRSARKNALYAFRRSLSEHLQDDEEEERAAQASSHQKIKQRPTGGGQHGLKKKCDHKNEEMIFFWPPQPSRYRVRSTESLHRQIVFARELGCVMLETVQCVALWWRRNERAAAGFTRDD